MNTTPHTARFARFGCIAACATVLLVSTAASAQKATYTQAAPEKNVSGLGWAAPGGGGGGGGKGDGPILGIPGKACRLMEMTGQLNEFIAGSGETVWYSKSFQLFGEKALQGQIPAQFLISVGANVSGGFTFNYPQGIAGEPEVLVYQSGKEGAVVYLPTNGSMSVLGTPADGDAGFTFHNLQLSLVNNATLQPIEDGDCINFYDFAFEGGVVSVPAAWTCAPELYSDDVCQCGCGVLDPVCASNDVDTCEACNVTGSCAQDESDCATIDPDDISQCYVPPVPVTPIYYNGDNGIGELITNTCAICHNGSYQIELSYAALLGDISSAGADYDENDGFSSYVVPADPDASALYAGWVEPGLMPTTEGGLSVANRQLIHDWIEQGALLAP